jgi:hypothetical protein
MVRNFAYLIYGFEIAAVKGEAPYFPSAPSFDCSVETIGESANLQERHFLVAEKVEAEVGLGKSEATEVDPEELVRKTTRAKERLRLFCQAHNILFEEPRWLLTADAW